eukprot:364062-Chlamydomonas_euryale.AAC.9
MVLGTHVLSLAVWRQQGQTVDHDSRKNAVVHDMDLSHHVTPSCMSQRIGGNSIEPDKPCSTQDWPAHGASCLILQLAAYVLGAQQP